MIQIYNTLTRKKELFHPLEEGKVRMYVCGPTVYNYIHIGNARSIVAFDTIRRYLEYRGYQVHYVSNFTDVDDKIINAAAKAGVTPNELVERFIQAFEEDSAALNVQPACDHPRVMEYIPEIIAFISNLIEKGYAYVANGDVYYHTRKFPRYGCLSHQSIDELEAGASRRTGSEQEQKQDPLDFALWKAAKPGEIFWDAPWGAGRPGWHIECSVMATSILGATIDIHGGGQDLEFPHHENEIAQSEAKTEQPFAKYWMHNGYVTVGELDEKMSKSTGNFVTVHELRQQVDPQILRFFMATTQYRRPIRYSADTLQDAETNLNRISTAYENALFRLKKTSPTELGEDEQAGQRLKQFEEQFIKEMDDDFNTANGITVVYELVKWLNQYSEKSDIVPAALEKAVQMLSGFLNVFGIELQQSELLDTEIEQLIEERKQARKEKNFARSDEIRDLLKEKGVLLEDTAQGTRWRRAK